MERLNDTDLGNISSGDNVLVKEYLSELIGNDEALPLMGYCLENAVGAVTGYYKERIFGGNSDSSEE